MGGHQIGMCSIQVGDLCAGGLRVILDKRAAYARKHVALRLA